MEDGNHLWHEYLCGPPVSILETHNAVQGGCPIAHFPVIVAAEMRPSLHWDASDGQARQDGRYWAGGLSVVVGGNADGFSLRRESAAGA